MQRSYPYQICGENKLREAFRQGKKRVVLTLPTGAGKTTIAARIVVQSIGKGRIVVALAHRTELIEQFYQRFRQFGVLGGFIKAGLPTDPKKALQIASVATLIQEKRLLYLLNLLRGQKVLLLVDECHRTISDSYISVIDAIKTVAQSLVVVGLTASPYRLDGQGLGAFYDSIVEVTTPAYLYDHGICRTCWQERPRGTTCTGSVFEPHPPCVVSKSFLVRPTFYAGRAPDTRGLHSRAGDYVVSELAKCANQITIVADIVSTYDRLCAGRTGGIYAVDRAHAAFIAEQFNDQARSFRRPVTDGGVFCAYMDGNTPADERAAILAMLAIGRRKLVSQCGVLIEGWDSFSDYERVLNDSRFWYGKSEPPPYIPLSLSIDACPTKSMSRWMQGPVGRNSRSHPDKEDAIILDHANNIYTFGMPDHHHTFSLEGRKKRAGSEAAVAASKEIIDCPNPGCGACYEVAAFCPFCNAPAPAPGQGKKREVVTVDGELVRVGAEVDTGKRALTVAEREQLYIRLMAHVVTRRKENPNVGPASADADYMAVVGSRPTPDMRNRVWRQFGFGAFLPRSPL